MAVKWRKKTNIRKLQRAEKNAQFIDGQREVLFIISARFSAERMSGDFLQSANNFSSPRSTRPLELETSEQSRGYRQSVLSEKREAKIMQR